MGFWYVPPPCRECEITRQFLYLMTICLQVFVVLHIVVHFRIRWRQRGQRMAPFHAILNLIDKCSEQEQVEICGHLKTIYHQIP